MNFSLTDDQGAIKRTARDFLAARFTSEVVRRLALEDERGYDDAHWREIADLGWPGIPFAEDDGGQGLGILELAVVCEELGYALAPTPLISSVLAGLFIAEAGDADQRARWLAPIAAGEIRATVALHDDHGGPSPHGSSLSGTKIGVTDAAVADLFVLIGDEGRVHVVEAGRGVEVEASASLDPTRRAAAVHFHNAEAHVLHGTASGAFDQAATALAAESVGVAQRAMEMAVEYARERRQFGRAIGSYQAVSHRCAQMLLEVECARSAVLHAGWALDHSPDDAPLAAAMAKAYASDAGWRVTASSLQVHGGTGFTWEHDLHLFLKRAKANAHLFGDARHHRRRVADLAGM